jgi:hypothetical protein
VYDATLHCNVYMCYAPSHTSVKQEADNATVTEAALHNELNALRETHSSSEGEHGMHSCVCQANIYIFLNVHSNINAPILFIPHYTLYKCHSFCDQIAPIYMHTSADINHEAAHGP